MFSGKNYCFNSAFHINDLRPFIATILSCSCTTFNQTHTTSSLLFLYGYAFNGNLISMLGKRRRAQAVLRKITRQFKNPNIEIFWFFYLMSYLRPTRIFFVRVYVRIFVSLYLEYVACNLLIC